MPQQFVLAPDDGHGNEAASASASQLQGGIRTRKASKSCPWFGAGRRARLAFSGTESHAHTNRQAPRNEFGFRAQRPLRLQEGIQVGGTREVSLGNRRPQTAACRRAGETGSGRKGYAGNTASEGRCLRQQRQYGSENHGQRSV